MAHWKPRAGSNEPPVEEPAKAPDPEATVETELDRLLKTRDQVDERIAVIRYEQRMTDLHDRIVAEVNRHPRPPGMILHALSLLMDEVRAADAKARRGG